MATFQTAKSASFIELAPARHNVYAYVCTAFREAPSATQLDSLSSELFLAEARRLFSDTVVGSVRQCATSAGSDDKWERNARQEFMNLFKVPGAQYVTPYESVFRDAREIDGKQVSGLLAGQSSVDVQKWYRLAAVEVSDEFKDLPDHIVLELSYMAHLCRKEQEFAAAGDEDRLTRAWEMERDFLAGHIIPWIGLLRDKICEKTRHPYFRAVAELAAEFAVDDLATLEDLLGPSQAHSVPKYDALPDVAHS